MPDAIRVREPQSADLLTSGLGWAVWTDGRVKSTNGNGLPFKIRDIPVAPDITGLLRITGSLLGAVPGQWPSWFAPRRVTLDGPPAHSFDRSYPLTADGTVFAVPTPGHMIGHMSVVVRTPEVSYLLTGDATYDEELLKQRIVDGLSENIGLSLNTLDRIAAFARSEPTVLLPAHDPLAEQQLAERITLTDD